MDSIQLNKLIDAPAIFPVDTQETLDKFFIDASKLN